MIDNESYKEILESGLLLDHYFLLCNLKNGQKLVETKRIQGFINLLTKKGYIEDGELTEKGLNAVNNCGLSDIVTVTEQTTQKSIDFATWAAALHKKCQEQIYNLTGLIQVRPKIANPITKRKQAFSFLCNPTDLANTLMRAIKTYKLKDYDLIEKAILWHIKECSESNTWFPLVQYYIMKDGASKMVTDIQERRWENGTEGNKSGQKFV